jgi:hypothetical protein
LWEFKRMPPRRGPLLPEAYRQAGGRHGLHLHLHGRHSGGQQR